MMQRTATRLLANLLAKLLGCLLLAVGLPARADTPVSLYQSFRGNVNFTGTAETLRSKDNKKPCNIVSGGVYAYLSGIPSGATIKSAQLYWAASGTKPDYDVVFDGIAVSAAAARRYVAKAVANNTTYTYFSGAADVTTQVAKKGNGYYGFSGLSVNNGSPWCAVEGVVGGFALAVVYSHPNEPFRMLNLYEGFQDFQYASLTIKLGDFNVPDPLPSNVTGRVGHITWEGDQTLSQGGEDLLFNGYEMVDKYPNSSAWFNPPGNQFNSASNVTGDATTYGIDFDIYTLKSPVIQPGQSSATTTYRSGQDLVILSAEIVAMPYVANADLALAMTRTGNLTVGSLNTYTLTVTNGGVDAEMGPVQVVDTLPAGLKLVSASGTGWTCTNAQSNGQTVVTCTQNGPVAAGAKMTPLVLTVTPTAGGNFTNTATVSGKTGDDKPGNNTATNTSAISNTTSSAYVFTREICKSGSAIVQKDDETGCHEFLGPVTAGDGKANIYVTMVSSTRVASTVPADTTKSVDFKFSCLPNSGVAIGYAGLSNFDCSGSSRTVSIKFLAGQPTAVLSTGAALAPFSYADVGRVALSMSASGSVLASTDFISRPSDIRFMSVFRADGTVEDEAYGFVAAGEKFTMRVGAWMEGTKSFAPSYGKEPDALKGVLESPSVAPVLDLFLLDPAKNVPVPDHDGTVVGALDYESDPHFVSNPAVAGAMDGVARWYEAGSFAATPYVDDYLGTGKVGGPPEQAVIDQDLDKRKRVVAGTRLIGRFYPDHFKTTVTGPFDCAPALNCPTATADPTDPANPPFPVRGAVYSGQQFTVTVTPYGLSRKGADTPLSLFQNDAKRPVAVSAVKAPNDTAAPAAAPAAFTPPKLATSSGAADFPTLEGLASYSTGNPYSPARRAAADWGAPTLAYVRASMTESLAPGGGKSLLISSRTPAAATAPVYEDGVMAIAGRLFVANAFGSDLLRVPVPLTAQYWTGTAWATSSTDNFSQVASAISPVTNGCRRDFAQDLKTGACKAAPLTAAGAVPVTLNGGKGTLVLQAPARGTVGSVDYTLDSAAAVWLPSTQARVSFGVYKSPLIYLREVY